MKVHHFFIRALILAFSSMAFSAIVSAAERVQTTDETLLDRIQVEDFIHDYYWELANESGDDITEFWAEDAEFDVNGNVLQGIDAIEEVYSRGLGPGGKLVFQPDIPRIRIDGNTAVVDLIYTGILNTAPDEAPSLYEQGHDHLELINTDGQWKITRRVLRSFSLDQSYEE